MLYQYIKKDIDLQLYLITICSCSWSFNCFCTTSSDCLRLFFSISTLPTASAISSFVCHKEIDITSRATTNVLLVSKHFITTRTCAIVRISHMQSLHKYLNDLNSSNCIVLYISVHVIRHFGRLVDSCVVSMDIFVFRREFVQWLHKCWRFWNWVSVPDVFAELARDFSRLKGVLFASHVTSSSPS